jgi:hypothetical protein
MQWTLDPRPSPVVYREVDLFLYRPVDLRLGKIYREADSDRSVLG